MQTAIFARLDLIWLAARCKYGHVTEVLAEEKGRRSEAGYATQTRKKPETFMLVGDPSMRPSHPVEMLCAHF
ncbi:hypothetical protein V5799_023793 [Amblyomma americanum]|uniref:Uncharacterized protein n=1 Tax=Amblyomma americanum TaxID=6943 RepID=A0AAQ4FI13_AMBAM